MQGSHVDRDTLLRRRDVAVFPLHRIMPNRAAYKTQNRRRGCKILSFLERL